MLKIKILLLEALLTRTGRCSMENCH